MRAAAPAALSQAAPPPSSPGGAGAVQAAESQIGVPYVWGAESPKGSASPGFDCSGLTAWSWGQVGVGLPHYSGAQMGDSTPVPISDLQPGDLLFYGPGGSEHVAMYVGPGTMIEAPYTGASVWTTGSAPRRQLRGRRPAVAGFHASVFPDRTRLTGLAHRSQSAPRGPRDQSCPCGPNLARAEP